MSAPLATWARRAELDAAAERAIAHAIREAGEPAPPHPNHSTILDADRMRGIPCLIDHGHDGAIRGTRPGDSLFK